MGRLKGNSKIKDENEITQGLQKKNGLGNLSTI